jgi:hypothetical protein
MTIDTATLRTQLASVGAAQGTRIQVADSLETIADILDTLVDGTQALDVASVTVDDDAYDSGWNGDLSVPTKNAVYDQMQTRAIVGHDGGTFSGGVFSSSGTSVQAVTTTQRTITVATNERITITIDGSYSHSAANGEVNLLIYEDSTGQTFEYNFKAFRANTGGRDTPFALTRSLTPSAGSKTYSLRVRTPSGTAYVEIRGFTIMRFQK